MGDINIPIQIESPNLVLNNKEYGKFTFSNGMMRSITQTVIVGRPTNPPSSTNVRPTLFITIPGFKFDLASLSAPDSNLYYWQTLINDEVSDLAVSSNPRHSQHKHIMIGWDSYKMMKRQVEDAADKINEFLDARAYPWDVVIIGHSRGGIFSHELSEQIVSHGNISNLHTILLDPTATIGVLGGMNDQYPLGKKNKSNGTHYGSLYYDDVPFAVAADISTVGDQPINGYDNYGRGSLSHSFKPPVSLDKSHGYFADEWIKDTDIGFERALADIWSKKDSATFAYDPAGGLLEKYDISESDFIFDGSVAFNDGNLEIDGMIVGGPVGATIDASFGKSGIDASTTVLIVSSQIAINKSYVGASANAYLTNASASLSTKGVNTSFDVLGSGGSVGAEFEDGIIVTGDIDALGISVDSEVEFGKAGLNIKINGTTIFSAETVGGAAVGVTESIAIEIFNEAEGIVVVSKDLAVGITNAIGSTVKNVITTTFCGKFNPAC